MATTDSDSRIPPSRLASTMAQGLAGSEILRIAMEIRAAASRGSEILDLSIGDFSPREFPIPRELAAGIADAVARGETSYPPGSGMPGLREAVRRLYERELGLTLPLESIAVSSGTRPLIYAAYRALVDPGDTVVYGAPSWNNNYYCHLAGARGVPVTAGPGTRFLPGAEALRPHMPGARMLALCSPQNPTGTMFSAEALAGICDLVLEENRRRGPGDRPLFLLYDQVYWMLAFGAESHHHPAGLRPAIAPYAILVDGISKALAATGLRVGFGAGPPAVMERMGHILAHMGAWAPRAEQVATGRFLDDPGRLDGFRIPFRAALKERLAVLHEGVQQMRDAGLAVDSIEPMGAIYLTVYFDCLGRVRPDGRKLESSDDVRRYLLEAAGIGVVPFEAFSYPPGSGWFRCSVGAVSVDGIRRGLDRLRGALESLR